MVARSGGVVFFDFLTAKLQNAGDRSAAEPQTTMTRLLYPGYPGTIRQTDLKKAHALGIFPVGTLGVGWVQESVDERRESGNLSCKNTKLRYP